MSISFYLVKSVVNWGSLPTHSGFAFESGNGLLLKAIQAAKGVTDQICKSIVMRKFESILKKYAQERLTQNASNFCTYLESITHKKSCKLFTQRYFGVLVKANTRWKQQLQLSKVNTVAYTG